MDEIFKSLTNLIKTSDNIILMTHRNMDLDGFGASLGLYEIIKSFNKKPHIFISEKKNNKSILKAFKFLDNENIDYITKKNYQNYLNDKSLLIILDTHRFDIIEYPEILEKTNNVVVIDHHVKGLNYIKNTVLSYIDYKLSSTNEIIVNYIKYLNKKISPLVATIMLSGIEIDTNSFNLKTTSDTYEAAAYLMDQGALNELKQELLKESKEEFVRKQEFIKDSFMINDNMALCLLDDIIHDQEFLSSIADELLQFDGVKASFVIGKIDIDTIGISARSLDKIDVEEYMSKLGGGGHTNEAATQIKNSTIKDVSNKLLTIVGD